jgi:hypothetical protein
MANKLMTATEIVNAAMKNLANHLANKMDADVLARAVLARWETISMAPKAPWVGMDYAIGLASTTPIPAFAHDHISDLRHEWEHERAVSGIHAGDRCNDRIAVLEARIQFIERELNGGAADDAEVQAAFDKLNGMLAAWNPAGKIGDPLNIRKPARFR